MEGYREGRGIRVRSGPMLALQVCDIMNASHELTASIAQLKEAFSSGFSEEFSPTPTCCCQKNDCKNYNAWNSTKLRLEEQITFTNDVGNTLLLHLQDTSSIGAQENEVQISRLVREKQALEKQLDQALVNNELAEVSSETLHKELYDARKTIAHLSASNAHYINLESRLLEVTRALDDMRQERDMESAKARRLKQESAALQLKSTKLHSEVVQLQHELAQKTMYQTEIRGSLLQGTKTQIQRLYDKLISTMASGTAEFTESLEAVWTLNDALKQHVRELEGFLTDARDEIHNLRERLDEQGAPMQTLQKAEHGRLPSLNTESDKEEQEEEDHVQIESDIVVQNSDSPRPSITISLVRDLVLRSKFC
ncbi:hypothetical protein C8R42DRAFT_642797 [Lentinula raphanica]|nr:hypothetical protein C8R42DRAFT_642797 [Lentinula raphanica]